MIYSKILKNPTNYKKVFLSIISYCGQKREQTCFNLLFCMLGSKQSFASFFLFLINIYMIKQCVIYCRVSTPKQAQEGESLGTQEKICRGIADTRKIKVSNVFSEPFSGRKDRRPVFDEMMNYLKNNNGKVQYVIVRMIDRFTRGGSLSYESIKATLVKYGVELIDSTGIIQPTKNTLEHLGVEYEWSRHAPSEIAEIVVANYGKTEVTNILTRLIGREIELVREGYQIGPANDGMMNKKIYVNGKKKTIQVEDPDRAKFFQSMFKMRASGRYTDEEIVKKINAIGFLTKQRNIWDKSHSRVIGNMGSKPLTVKKLQKIMIQPNYCGVICEKWTNYQPILAKYNGLVSIKLFNQASRGKVHIVKNSDNSLQLLYDYNLNKNILKRQKNNPLFPFKNIVLCPLCRKPFLGSSPKGKSGKGFPIYHCSRGHRYFGISKKKLEYRIEEFVKNIKCKKEFLISFESTLLNKYRERQKELTHFSASVSTTVAKLKIEQTEALNTLIKSTSDIVKKAIEKRIEELEKQILKTQEERHDVEITECNIKEFINRAKYLMEHLESLLLCSQNMTKQQALFGLLFKEFPTYEELVNGTPKLSLIFELSQQFKSEKSRLVARTGIEPVSPH